MMACAFNGSGYLKILPSASSSINSVSQMSQESAPPSGSSSSSFVGRKRKVPDSITPIACTNCKKARSKCDGFKPACQRCKIRNVPNECHYELHAKTVKEQMVREIQRLQRRNETLEEENGTLGERNDWIERIMGSLKDDSYRIEIIRRLKRGESHREIAEWLGRPMAEIMNDLSPGSEFQISEAINKYHRDFINNNDPCFWTSVTLDGYLIEHLINLYFTWIHPVHMLFDEGKLLASFNECADKYCSYSLVNAICAMSCYFLHNSCDNDRDAQAAISSLRLRFMDEVRSALKDASDDKMTVIQTYAIMFLVELSSGNGSTATSHLRLAVELLIQKQQNEQSMEPEEISSWGLLTLHTAWSGFIYSKPSAPISTKGTVFRNVDLDREGTWPFYRQPGDDVVSNRPSYSILIAAEHAKLYRIIHETILVYCGKTGKISADELSELYDRYMGWKDELPDIIQSVDGDNSAVPHALCLHIQYFTGLINFLQPLIHSEKSHELPYVCVQDLVIQYSRQGLALLRQYVQMFSFIYQSPLQLFCIVHICDALIRYGIRDETTSGIVSFCLESLQAAKASYPIAGPLQKMFCLAVAEYGTPVSDELERLIAPSSECGPEDMLEAVTRLSYRMPFSQLLPNMPPTLAIDFIRKRQQSEDENFDKSPSPEDKDKKINKRMQIESLLNT